MAVVYELIIIPIFWSLIFPGLLNEEKMKDVLPDIDDSADTNKLGFFIVSGVLDHTVPLVVLMIDFTFNCIPFTTRHFLVTITTGLLYAVFNISYTLKVETIYPGMDFSKFYHYFYMLGGFLWSIMTFFCIVYFSKVKLRRAKKSVALQ